MEEKETLYARWLSGELSDEEAKALTESGELAALQEVIGAVDQFKLKPYDKEAAFAKLDLKPKAKLRRLPVRTILAVAASVVALIIAGLSFWGDGTVNLSTPHGKTLAFTLPDGSTGTLNAGSSLNYDGDAWPKERIIELQGEAYFDVKSGSTFRVLTQNGEVEVLGTQFNVRAWNKRFIVECYEGRVKVQRGSQLDTLTKGTMVTIANGQSKKENIAQNQPNWQNGIIVFDAAEATEVLDEAERLYDIQLEGKEQLIGTFSGNLHRDSLEKFLDKLIFNGEKYKAVKLDQKRYKIEK
jgi:ferric-dicitrate binding protein FerR (iron transport regulator)